MDHYEQPPVLTAEDEAILDRVHDQIAAEDAAPHPFAEGQLRETTDAGEADSLALQEAKDAATPRDI